MNQLAATPVHAAAPVSSLTPDQQAGADAFFTFLLDPGAKVFVLSGGPGVGKSFLMSHLVRTTMKDYANACSMLNIKEQYDTLAFTATTNKAAEVLEQSLGIPVQTIQSFLSLRVIEDHKTGKTRLEKTQAYRVRHRHIVFIDECSMVDSSLYQIIMESFQDSKIIFVGDHFQMAPVGEPHSPVFLEVDPGNFIYLSQPVRNAGQPALVQLCAQLRETVETGVFRPIKEVPGVIEYLDDTSMLTMLHKHFKDPEPSARVLCYTNSRVEAFNEFIREEVRGLPAQFQVGDHLVVAQTYTSGKDTINVEREAEILKIRDQDFDLNHVDATPGAKPIPYREAEIRIKPSKASFTVRLATDKTLVAEAIKTYARRKDWSSYFELKNRYCDLRDKAACTVYKSQGSTYETVFIDIGNIGTSYDKEQVARMLFVAASRATTRVYLYGRLPPAYRGKDSS